MQTVQQEIMTTSLSQEEMVRVLRRVGVPIPMSAKPEDVSIEQEDGRWFVTCNTFDRDERKLWSTAFEIHVTPSSGVDVVRTLEEGLELANTLGARVRLTFNDHEFILRPGDNPADHYKRYVGEG